MEEVKNKENRSIIAYQPPQEPDWQRFARSINAAGALNGQHRAAPIVLTTPTVPAGGQSFFPKKLAIAIAVPLIVTAAILLMPLPPSQAEPSESTTTSSISQEEEGTEESAGASADAELAKVEQPAVVHPDSTPDSVSEGTSWKDTLWFDQSSFNDETYQDSYTIAKYGGGLCATTCAVDILFEEQWNPVQIASRMKAWAAENGDVKYCSAAGTIYDEWKKTVMGAFDVSVEELHSLDEAYDALSRGKILVACGAGNVFKTADGQLTNHDGRLLCFYKTDGSRVWAKDSSPVYGGPEIEYSPSEFAAFITSDNCFFAISR